MKKITLAGARNRSVSFFFFSVATSSTLIQVITLKRAIAVATAVVFLPLSTLLSDVSWTTHRIIFLKQINPDTPAMENSSVPQLPVEDRTGSSPQSPRAELPQLLGVQAAHFLNMPCAPEPCPTFVLSCHHLPFPLISTSWNPLSFRAELRCKAAAFPNRCLLSPFPTPRYPTSNHSFPNSHSALLLLFVWSCVMIIWAGVSSPIWTVSFLRTYSP